MPRYEIRAGDQAFTCPLSATTEEAALYELASAWERSSHAGNSKYAVPGSEPPTSIDLTRGQLVTACRLDERDRIAPTNHQIHDAGRHLAVAEALMRGYKAALVGRSSHIEVNGHRSQVQVAAKGAWQIANVDRYIADTIERVVLVDITDDRRKIYICPGDVLRSDVRERYDQFLNRQGGVRPRNPGSKHAAIYPEQVRKWHDNWSLFA